jgi:hypothetical protein
MSNILRPQFPVLDEALLRHYTTKLGAVGPTRDDDRDELEDDDDREDEDEDLDEDEIEPARR